jgi:hypothetical protein
MDDHNQAGNRIPVHTLLPVLSRNHLEILLKFRHFWDDSDNIVVKPSRKN